MTGDMLLEHLLLISESGCLPDDALERASTAVMLRLLL